MDLILISGILSPEFCNGHPGDDGLPPSDVTEAYRSFSTSGALLLKHEIAHKQRVDARGIKAPDRVARRGY